MNTKQLLVSLILILILGACNSSEKSESAENKEKANTETKKREARPSGISLDLLPSESPTYADAKLKLVSAKTLKNGQVAFNFNVENFDLGAQSLDAAEKSIANSEKGQHIHFIENNSLYSAHYEADFTKELSEGNHVILAFLSRSYHESLKSGSAAVITQVQVGEGAKEIDLDQPIMFYSRPKGTYKGADTKNILLDFYLHNVALEIGGYTLRATINDMEFIITRWLPFVIKGAPLGELHVKLELLDAEGNLVNAPFNPVERTVILEE